MQKPKCWVSMLFALVLCLSLLAAAKAEWVQPFGDQFVQQYRLTALSDIIACSEMVSGDTVYYMTIAGTIYTWDAASGLTLELTHVQTVPNLNTEKPLSKQNRETQDALKSAVTDLVASPSGIYGLNDITGAIGPIDKDGIHFQETRLDTSILFPSGSDYAERTLYDLRLEDDTLTGWTILDDEAAPNVQYLTFHLSDGTCDVTTIPGAITLCRFSDGKLLALVESGTATPTFTVYNTNGELESALHYSLPPISLGSSATSAYDLRSLVGGLAYDERSSILYITDGTSLWRSVGGEAFQAVDVRLPWTNATLNPAGEAWTLKSGGYVISNGWLYCMLP